MLLTVNFPKTEGREFRPLSNTEWGRFAFWLRDHELSPERLLEGDVQNMLQGMNDPKIPMERIQWLLRRGAALGLSLEKWQRAGLWAITRGDEDYPDRIKRRLRAMSPPVLFGCGNKALLNKGGLAVVGSRNASEDDLSFAKQLGQRTAASGFSIVSGGARGVDQAAMEGALDADGTGVAIVANNLMRTSASAAYRSAIRRGDLVLASPFNPEAGFSVGNAMGRNKYLYCLADAAVVVSSTPNKGGTWSGATEALKHQWVPVYLKPNPPAGSGNPLLVELGARWLPQEIGSIESLVIDPTVGEPKKSGKQDRKGEDSAELLVSDSSESIAALKGEMERANTGNSAFDSFIVQFRKLVDGGAIKEAEIAKQLGLPKKQVKEWLKRGVDEGTIFKLHKPVRYDIASEQAIQPSFFDDDT